MSIAAGEFLFLTSMAMCAVTMACWVATLIMQLFMPKALLQKYFKPPYFSQWEVLTFSGYPFGYLRTVMFMRLVAFPSSGKKRKLTQAYKLAPPSFRLCSKVILIIFAVSSFLLFALLLFFAIYLWVVN